MLVDPLGTPREVHFSDIASRPQKYLYNYLEVGLVIVS